MLKIAIIVHENGKYYVKTEDGSRTLGTHKTRRDAEIQLYAIHKSQERESKKEKKAAMKWSERYAIANEQEFNQAMGDQFGSMSRAFMDHYADMYGRHHEAIRQLNRRLMNTYDPDKKDIMREGIGKHEHCRFLINGIMGKHSVNTETGDDEDHYKAVANDAFQHSNGILSN